MLFNRSINFTIPKTASGCSSFAFIMVLNSSNYVFVLIQGMDKEICKCFFPYFKVCPELLDAMPW
jgi:hypothetical protein